MLSRRDDLRLVAISALMILISVSLASTVPTRLSGDSANQPPEHNQRLSGWNSPGGFTNPASVLSTSEPPRAFSSHPAIVLESRASPADSALAGTFTSANWGGYVYCASNDIFGNCNGPSSSAAVTGVSAEWVVPSYANTSTSVEMGATWVGVGGWGSNDLVQDGLSAVVYAGLPVEYYMWWEMLPASSVAVSLSPNPAISPGDLVYASTDYSGLNGAGYQEWTFVVGDTTTGSQWQGTEICGAGCYGSQFETADWIQESPEVGSSLVQMPAFSTFNFQETRFYTSSTGWSSFTVASPRGNIVYEQNSAYSPADLVVPSGLTGSAYFSENYLVQTQQNTTGCCGISQSSIEPGQLIGGSDNIWSPDSFTTSQAQNLGLEVALVASNGSLVDKDAADGSIGFSVNSGQNSYSASFRAAQGTPYGSYHVLFMLWYVPPGGRIGGSGSLLLQESGGATYGPALRVYGPSDTQPVAVPGSGLVDAGQNATFATTATGGSGNYSYTWSGPLPASSCSSPESVPQSIRCLNMPAGTFNVSVTVTDAVGATFTSAPLTFVVMPDPTVGVPSANRTSADAGQDVSFLASVTGGSGGFTFVWNGLPSGGCSGTTGSMATCASVAQQVLEIYVVVTDSNGMRVTSGVLTYTIHSDPTAGTLKLSPLTVDVGQSIVLSVNASGGSWGYKYSWVDLPPGCTSTDSSVLSCIPEGSGSFGPRVTITDSNGVSAQAAGTFLVSPLPSVQTPAASPPIIYQGHGVTFHVATTAGSGGLSYLWSGLPPGCDEIDGPTLTCTPGGAGTWSVVVTVTDSNGGTATSAALNFTVRPTFLGLPQAEGIAVLGGGLAALAAVVIAALSIRRRKGKPGSPVRIIRVPRSSPR